MSLFYDGKTEVQSPESPTCPGPHGVGGVGLGPRLFPLTSGRPWRLQLGARPPNPQQMGAKEKGCPRRTPGSYPGLREP